MDLLVTSPPFWALRSYTDTVKCLKCIDLERDGRDPRQAWPDYDAHIRRDHIQHYEGQIGAERTPEAYLEELWACTAEWVRVLKPEGSMFIELGDKYATRYSSLRGGGRAGLNDDDDSRGRSGQNRTGTGEKSLLGLPWRYALGCVDRLGLILRRDIIWHHANGLPESVTDRCRSAHSYVFHFTRQPRYYAAVDEIREPHAAHSLRYYPPGGGKQPRRPYADDSGRSDGGGFTQVNALGKLPGSVWEIPSAPLSVPAHLGVDHFACVDAETEILTNLGWLRHWELNPGVHKVAGYDLDTNTARWTDCLDVSRYDYDGEMIAVESRDLSMRLTPNHRTIVQRMDTRTKRRNPLSVVRADELDRYHFIPRSAIWDDFGEFRAGDRLAAVMGWVAAEGWYDRQDRVRLSQSLDANAAHVAEIDQLIPDAARHERKRAYRGQPYIEINWTLGPVANLIRREMPDKLLPWWLVMTTEPERRALLGAFIDGDGHRRPDGRIGIFQKHRHNLDVLQAIAVTLGYKTTIRGNGKRFVLYLTEGGRSVTLRGTSGVGSKVKREHYRGVVWCPSTGTGTFIARRNGSVFVTGNSFPPALVRPIVLGWSPPGVCTACGQGRRPVSVAEYEPTQRTNNAGAIERNGDNHFTQASRPHGRARALVSLSGYACACTPYTDHPGTGGSSGPTYSQAIADGSYAHPLQPSERLTKHQRARGAALDNRPRVGPWREYHFDGWTPPPTRPAIVLDPFSGTGTVPLVASVHGRHGIGVDLSHDYSRLARWRVRDPGERARALNVPKPPPVPDGQGSLFDDLDALITS